MKTGKLTTLNTTDNSYQKSHNGIKTQLAFHHLPFDVQAGGQMPQFSGPRYQRRPTGIAQTRTFIGARRSLGLGGYNVVAHWVTTSS